jgi:succinyl-diaminopimelate desuccinylase
MDECVLAERLITYDTATGEGLRAAAGFVKGWLESREITVDGREHDELPVILAEVGPKTASTWCPRARASSRRASKATG